MIIYCYSDSINDSYNNNNNDFVVVVVVVVAKCVERDAINCDGGCFCCCVNSDNQ